ncbi:GNAT family N-acetyltransferase [Plantactinospora sp. WMMB782]|uniref:GNAT family N-acetyltransferase n=1 Tax=Plantactinospora sp. WMMB782 TaxID=3404121 RepID=UPI003B95C217
MAVTVRRAGPVDAPALARLRWRCWAEGRDGPAADRDVYLEVFTSWTVDHLATHLPFLAELDGRIAGMAWLMLAERVPSPDTLSRRTGDVQSVYVIPELRDRGVGRVLLEAVLAEARLRELEHVTVHANDRATPFYLRAGFVEGRNWLEWRP